MNVSLSSPLSLPCGAALPNRIAKAALTEGLADANNRATIRHQRLYRRWSDGGAGLVITGNVQVDRGYLERPGNIVLEDRDGLEALAALTAAGTVGGNHLWMQIGHAGRQTPRRVNPVPVAPSAVPLALPERAFGPPRALEEWEILDIVQRFAFVAQMAQHTGFTGVQIHAAHGYLISEFLSPLANRRQDEWGGNLQNRARLLLEIIAAVRRNVGLDFPIGVKLNSSDFQKGGFSHEESEQVVRWLTESGVDLLEISGGNYEQPSMMGAKSRETEPVAASTRAREAYFLDYADSIRKITDIPVMVTGGFRSRVGMSAALEQGATDVIGLGRPLCVEPDLPASLLNGTQDQAPRCESQIRPAKAGLAWFCLQLIRMGDGLNPDIEILGTDAMARYLDNEEQTAKSLQDHKLKESVTQ